MFTVFMGLFLRLHMLIAFYVYCSLLQNNNDLFMYCIFMMRFKKIYKKNTKNIQTVFFKFLHPFNCIFPTDIFSASLAIIASTPIPEFVYILRMYM